MPLFLSRQRHFFLPALGLLALGLTAGCGRREETPAAAAPAPAAAPQPAAPAPAARPASAPKEVQALLGRWLRSDGGYSLELRSADASGVMEAAYFNPKPIKVSRAIWMRGAQGLQVMVELNDVGYPGATYVLSPDTTGDRLGGQYTQPAMQQSFDIEFVRQK